MKGQGSSSPALAYFCCSRGPSGASLRLPVRLMKWMDGAAGKQTHPEAWQTGAHRTPLRPRVCSRAQRLVQSHHRGRRKELAQVTSGERGWGGQHRFEGHRRARRRILDFLALHSK